MNPSKTAGFARLYLPRLLFLGLLVLLPWLIGAAPLSAPLPAGVDAGQLERRFQTPAEAKATGVRPLVVPNTGGAEAPPGAESMRFVLQQVQIEGAQHFSTAQLAPLYAELLGQQISLDQVYALADRITAHYGNAGYLLSRALVPPQTIDAGRVKISVVEGFVSQVLMENAPAQRPELFQHYREQILASRPLHVDALERYLLLANDLPGQSFKSVLEPAPQTPGAALMRLTGSSRPFELGLSLDNRGSETSGPWQLLLDATAYNLLNRLDSTSLRFASVPDSPEELKYWQLSHQQVLNAEGLRLGLDWSQTRSEPGGSLMQQLDVETRGDSLGLSLSYPLIRSRAQNLSLSAGLSDRLSETLQLSGSSLDELRILRLGLLYDRADAWGGGGINLLSLNLSQGLDWGDVQVNSRALAQPDFTKLDFQLRRSQRLGAAFSADLRLSGQYTSGSLPSAEEFGLGGESSLRGYEPSEWTGDKALSAGVELRYQVPVSWQGGLQLYGFAEAGKVWRNHPQPGQGAEQSADALGLGARVQLPHQLDINLEAAHANDTHADGSDPGWQLYARLLWRY